MRKSRGLESTVADKANLIDKHIDLSEGRADAFLAESGVPVWALIGEWDFVKRDKAALAELYAISNEEVEAALEFYRRNKQVIDARIEANDLR